ncbi:AAA family ATPase [Pseudoalteromonas luteoviolacea]|uniref:Uncharacterized protein n=1 Tax=Pseudoalteromonas luteoviolacea H33 TaxID=1365251 RepID=A0A167DWJ4_9GAMM|nr:AAA family ATPase [Pseudoalteromonas luteoviolacea]KZN49466.1 hypothetical protein N476_19470 [Pseudoalteromonas luteoviolacea H33]KZN72601.1 hypothetical protein N477_24710 [Pseudoalteromonas luteoviolacea H33-S]
MAGQVAFGKHYFPREKDENKIWRRLNRGSHLLLLAPRRVGKTSLLRHLESQPKDGYVFLYNIVQSCSSVHEYYKCIIDNLFRSEFTNKLSKLSQWSTEKLNDLKGSIKGLNISEAGIEFDNQEQSLTHHDLKAVLEKIKINQKLIIVIDEFPDVLEKIHDQHGHAAAEQFLAGCRELWQEPNLDRNIQFIFTGSIGLDSLVNKLNLSDLINVLMTVTVTPLTTEKALAFIGFVSSKGQENLILTNEIKRYLLEKVGWYMPYYIETLVLSVEDHCCENDITSPSQQDIDMAYEQLFTQNYLSNFNHWAERLHRLEKSEQRFAYESLNHIAEHGEITLSDLHNNKASPTNTDVNTGYVIECLKHDGYIFENGDDAFEFTSPMLKEWWRRHAAR